MDGGFVQDRKDQQATKDGLKNTCLSLCCVLLGVKEASVGFSKVHFRLDVTREAQFFFFFGKVVQSAVPAAIFHSRDLLNPRLTG